MPDMLPLSLSEPALRERWLIVGVVSKVALGTAVKDCCPFVCAAQLCLGEDHLLVGTLGAGFAYASSHLHSLWDLLGMRSQSSLQGGWEIFGSRVRYLPCRPFVVVTRSAQVASDVFLLRSGRAIEEITAVGTKTQGANQSHLGYIS